MNLTGRRQRAGYLAVVVCTATAILTPAAANAGMSAASTGYRLVWDTFDAGFNAGTAKWFLVPAGSFANGDGVPTTAGGQLTVVPTVVNPTTNNPAFAFTTGQEA